MANAHVRMTRAGELRIEGLSADQIAELTRQVHRDVKRRVPQDTGELSDSIRVTVTPTRGTVSVGTDHWAATEYGSRPHEIKSTGAWPLRSRETGQVFGRTVKHPGTPEQPFMRPALYKRRHLS